MANKVQYAVDGEVRPRLDKIHRELEALTKRNVEVIEELRALLAEEPSETQYANRLLAYFCEQYEKRHAKKYVVANGAKAVQQLRRLLKQIPPREIAGRMQRFLVSKDPFYVDAKHDLHVFIAAVNKFSSAPLLPEGAAPARGCKHEPPCVTDEQHTKRSIAEAKSR
jgi:molybdopterin converting factor small subunit